jgi:hypothetical protein
MSGRAETEHAGAAAAIADAFVVGQFAVSVRPDGDAVEIEIVSPTASEWTENLRAEMQEAVELFLLALSLRTSVALTVEWKSADVVAADGRRHLMAWEPIWVVKARDAAQPLGSYVGDARLITGHQELRAALELCRGSWQLATKHPGASMALAYMAAESLVTHVLASTTGSLTTAGDWARAAPLLGSPSDSLLQLLWSTQLGRHIDPVRAKRELANRGWPALAAIHCCELALDIIVAYANTL